jgi:endonuclease YncB( thermonuclease family)
MLARALLPILVVLAAPAAWAESLQGKVVRVSDGDTITLLVERKQVKVRLKEIDAPESKQAFGERSRKSLGEMCAGQQATVHYSVRGKYDKYGRVLGRVECQGLDANAEQVRRCMAWVYDSFVTDRSLYALQNGARAAHAGLWADKHPTAPWEWRKQRKLAARNGA